MLNTMMRKIYGSIFIRFSATEALLTTFDVLNSADENDKDVERAIFLVVRELTRRNVRFW